MCDTVKIKELYQKRAEELISLFQIKSYLKIEFNEQDDFLNEVIATTRQYAEKFLSMHLIRKIYRQINIADNRRNIPLIKTPVSKVRGVFIIDLVGKKIELKQEDYEFDGFNKILIYRQDVFYKSIETQYMVGYENINLVPSPIKTGMMIHAASIYDRGDLGDAIPQSTLNLYQPYRRISL